MNEHPAKAFLRAYIEKTDADFDSYLEERIQEAMEISKVPGEMLRRFGKTAKRGKRIRGALVVLGYLAAGGTKLKEIYSTSLFIELFQAGILVQDDVMDYDEVRRDLPALHKQFEQIGESLQIKNDPLHFGESLATLVGDVAFFYSWEKLMQSSFGDKAKIDASVLYTQCLIRLVHGQSLDLTNTNINSTAEKDVLKVMTLKTAEYTGIMPLQVGATLAECKNKKQFAALERYGLELGRAFQIQDDLLAMYGEDIGKPVGNDIREGKCTYLILDIMKHGSSEHKRTIKRLLGDKNLTEKDVDRVRTILTEAGCRERVFEEGMKHVARGQKEIPAITKDKKLQEIFDSLITYVMERAK